MLFSTRTLLTGVAGVLAASNLAAASPQGGPISKVPSATIPGHCSTTIDDFPHTTATVKTHECYTYTREAASCECLPAYLPMSPSVVEK